MSGFRGNVINIDDGYIGTLNVGAVVFAASDINPIPGDAFGIYRGTDDSFAVSDPTSGSSNVIVENAFILTSFGLASNKIFTVDTTHPNADFTTIQAAYDASDDGYIILVSPGSYNEQLTLRSGITVEIRGTGPDYASTNIEYVLSGDGYVVSGPTSGAGSIVFKNMNIALRYNGFSGSTATILARSSSFGWVFRDCYITAYTLGASGGQTHAILANAASVMEFYNCEIVADDNDGIFNVESIRQTNSTIILNNTDIYGINNYDIHADDPSATLYIDNSNIAGTVNIQNMQNVILDRVSTIGAFAGNITDDDTENLLINRAYGVGLTSGQNEFYKLHLREIGQVDVGAPGDGQIWYSRAAGRFRMKEGGTVKDMIPYSVLDGYGGAAGVTQTPSFTGSDGYVAFFTGNNNIAGDDDLFWDRVGCRLGIHTKTPLYPLHVIGNDSVSAMFVQNDFDGYVAEFFNDGNSPNRAGIKIRCGQDTPGAGSSVSAVFMVFAEGDDAITGQISATPAGVVSLIDVSDEAKKTNISPTRINALDIVNNIELIEYNRIKKNVEYDKVDIGFSAQNCQESYPAMVSPMVDGSFGIAKSELIPVLTKAIQEQDAKIKDQQEQIDELKKLVKKLLKE